MKNKNLKALFITVAIVVFIAIVIYLYKKSKGAKTEENTNPVLGGTIDEPIEDAPKNTDVSQVLDTTNGLGATIIDRRARDLYQNKTSLESIIQRKGVPVPDASGTKFPAGIARVLNDSGFQSFPVVPNFISPAYKAEINNFLGQPDFENLARANFDSAKSTYQIAMNFNSIRWYPFPALDKAVQESSFGNAGKADKNKSERYDAAIKDMKTVFQRVLDANKKLEEALKAQAIEDLRASGYKFIGHDV
jgi:hypothetical protein